jgi:hypothetical protein
MIKCKIDKIVDDKDGHVVYIHMCDGDTEEVLDTSSFIWHGKEDFKSKMKKKILILQTSCKVKKAKMDEIQQALRELEEEEEK